MEQPKDYASEREPWESTEAVIARINVIRAAGKAIVGLLALLGLSAAVVVVAAAAFYAAWGF